MLENKGALLGNEISLLSLLQLSIEIENLKVFLYLYKKYNSINKNENSGDLLEVAVKKDKIDFVRLLLFLKYDINRKDEMGNTLLHIAIINLNIRITYLLLIKGADRAMKNQNGKTPLELAKSLNNKRIIGLFVR